MVTTDFHIHTDLSVDSTATADQMVRRAIELGLTEIALTDHVDHNPADDGAGCYDPDKAWQVTRDLRERYRDNITIRHGAELGEPHLYTRENNQMFQLPMDVVIGSIHCIGPYGVHSDYFDNKPQHQGIVAYFQLMLELVRTADIDILGHLDYFDRYTLQKNLPAYDPKDYRDPISQILRTLIDRNIALEVNTSGYRSAAARPFPHPQVLEWYYQLGGRLLSIGSDAHQPDHFNNGFDQTTILLRKIGFGEYHTFEARHPVAVKL